MTRWRRVAPALALAVAGSLGCPSCSAQEADRFAQARERMLREVVADARATGAETGRPELAPAVLEAMARVPRQEFVPQALRSSAYDNRPLPIGEGQTISQPFIVALMTDLAQAEPGDRVLEIGTGSGYQAAVLAALGTRVFTVEIVPELARDAERRLQRLGFDTVVVHLGDGGLGWPDNAPYDAIVVTAAAPRVPPALLEQLGPGGRLVLPIGEPGGIQSLVVVSKDDRGAVSERRVLAVAFVPLTGQEGR